MTGTVSHIERFRPCPEMERAHEAVDRGDERAAAGHYRAAADVAFALARATGERTKWLTIGALRTAWGFQAEMRSA